MPSHGQPQTAPKAIHIDIYDAKSRSHWAETLGVSDERLRKAVRMVGTRLSSVTAYLAK
ncbi:DUF3606 domain-containing protein [Methylobacterium organophilum]|uniref:DUF3606 domain-containing protein n=1 Tax=Methylobacterium organophilum TaxID=410 RepID=A0ABQ4T8Y0_METOR|nr:DUF3606 domain-containing protein [Methylobacterium organophilum]GJE28125.1 hypothetical protein LKMONMHP_2991 [Methylobacterium organophilum]